MACTSGSVYVTLALTCHCIRGRLTTGVRVITKFGSLSLFIFAVGILLMSRQRRSYFKIIDMHSVRFFFCVFYKYQRNATVEVRLGLIRQSSFAIVC